MAKLKITKVNGEVREYEITPVIEYAFENHTGKGFHRQLIEDAKQSDIYWLCWEAMKRGGEVVVPFGEKFVETLREVQVLDSDPLE
jgi:hypothetical protein